MTEKPRRLATYVRVGGRKYGPEDDIPPEVAAQITNPKVWAAPEDVAVAHDSGATTPKRRGGTRMGDRLASYVHVGGRRYGPDDEIPDEVARAITNPKAWVGGRLPDVAKGGVVDSRVTADNPPPLEHLSPVATAPAATEPTEAGTAAGEPERMPAPKRSGRGSGLDAWQAFAVDHDVEFADGASRDDIIAACVRAGVIPAE